ncbi:outer envelope protein 64, chloroplastic-like [Solanum dulcamara]|uniref:outer envelope protein 64, chloroplastic-like n=1 Tax=Solanum dulcamara TaxID=45834 RepID=UPI0024854E31|nr:outer envelope protein 64, chloroplastic-like [Solanum dulcamara]
MCLHAAFSPSALQLFTPSPLHAAISFTPPSASLLHAVLSVRFDINGFVTGFGNPDWSRTHEPASQTSTVVKTLVEGGATCTGRTVVDDMAFGISGEQRHFDTPTNPAMKLLEAF